MAKKQFAAYVSQIEDLSYALFGKDSCVIIPNWSNLSMMISIHQPEPAPLFIESLEQIFSPKKLFCINNHYILHL